MKYYTFDGEVHKALWLCFVLKDLCLYPSNVYVGYCKLTGDIVVKTI